MAAYIRTSSLAAIALGASLLSACATSDFDYRKAAKIRMKPGAVIGLAVISNRKPEKKARLEHSIYRCVDEAVKKASLDIRIVDPTRIAPTNPDQQGWNAYAADASWRNALQREKVEYLVAIHERALGKIRGSWQKLTATILAVNPHFSAVGSIRSETTDRSGQVMLILGVIYLFYDTLAFPVPVAIPPSPYESINCQEFGKATVKYFADTLGVQEKQQAAKPEFPEFD
jgi:hypothetical protein